MWMVIAQRCNYHPNQFNHVLKIYCVAIKSPRLNKHLSWLWQITGAAAKRQRTLADNMIIFKTSTSNFLIIHLVEISNFHWNYTIKDISKYFSCNNRQTNFLKILFWFSYPNNLPYDLFFRNVSYVNTSVDDNFIAWVDYSVVSYVYRHIIIY